MGISVENLNLLFVSKYSNYIDLMKVAGLSEEEIESKTDSVKIFGMFNDEQKSRVVSSDLNFINFLCKGGIEDRENDTSLYKGINEQIAKSIISVMSSIDNNTVLPKDMEKEIDEVPTLMKIKDMVSKDMSDMFPDIKKLFFNGNYKEFNNRMNRIYSSEEIENLNDIVDSSVYKNDESGLYQYIDLIEKGLSRTKEIDYNQKNIAL